MSFSAQAELDTILSLLQNPNAFVNQAQFPDGTITPADPTAGINFIGDAQNNIARTGLTNELVNTGNDLMIGNDGNDFLASSAGNDGLFGGNGNDRLEGGAGHDRLFGNVGDDQLFGGLDNDFIAGGAGSDVLDADIGEDFLIGGDSADFMRGGQGADTFAYEGDVFANGIAAPAGNTGINVLNTPDIISDFTIGQDKLGFSGTDLGIRHIAFQKGQSSQIAGDGNVIVLTDPFAAAGAAARAIADNPNITADEGAFVYFNSTLGLTRLVYSKDLSDGGNISVLANLDNQRGDAGLANVANFSANEFSVF